MNVSLTGPWSRRLALALFGIGLMTAAVAAQSGRPPRGPARRAATPQPTPNVAPASATRAAGQPGRPAIDAIYQAATQAATVGEIQQALDRCDQLGAQPLAAEDLEYLQQLQAWLLNRRGEAYALAAGRSAAAGSSDEATRWERLAADDFARSIQLHPDWRAFHNRGVSLAMVGEYQAALASFGSAVELNPTYANTRFNRAELWLELGNYEEAEREYTEVLRLEPEDVDSRIGRGHARFYLTRFDEALADFDDVIRRQPDNAVPYADRADLQAYLGQWEPAAQDYRTAIQLDKSLGRAFQSAAWLMATCPDQRFRDEQLALRAAQRSIELDGSADYRYLDTLAAAQANAGQFAEALKSVQQAIQTAPADVRGELQQRQGLYQAQRPFRDAVR